MHRCLSARRAQQVCTVLLLGSLAPLGYAGQVVNVGASRSQTNSFAGGFAALADPSTPTTYYTDGTDFSFPIFYDSGASGNLLSQFSSSTLNVPLTNESYSDVGIGGTEVFNVSQPTALALALSSAPNPDDPAEYSSFGTYKFQVKKQDVMVDGVFAAPFDVIGTPTLRSRVMHVQPNQIDFSSLTDMMHTEFLASMPTKAQLPAKGVFHIPIQYKNFVNGAQPVTTESNPVIEGVKIQDIRKPSNQQSAPHEWLLDTGGSVTIIGRNYAAEVGIDLANETPVNTVTVYGVGNDQRTLNGYQIDHLDIPMANGDDLVYDNMIVYVPADNNTLPADIGGIFGVNNLSPSFESVDPTTGLPDQVDSRYSDWYLNSPGNELVLVDPNSNFVGSVPEPVFGVALMGGVLMLRRRRRA